MKIKNIITTICFSLASSAFAQTNTGQINTQLDVNVTIPQLCSFTSPKLSIKFADYVGNQQTASDRFYSSCMQNTVLDIELSMGSNPLSTIEERRLPLNGEQGDVEYYIPYRVNFSNHNGPLLGTGNDKHTHTFDTSSSWVYLYVTILADLNLRVGDYSDQLNLTFTYY